MSEYLAGDHVLFHHFDGKDYEAVITDVHGPGSDVADEWVVHLNVGKLGTLKNITEGTREDPTVAGTFSMKNVGAASARAGTEVPVAEGDNSRPVDLPSEDDEPAGELTPEEQIHAAVVATEDYEPNEGDEGLDTPANYVTDNRLESGEPISTPES